MTPEQLDEIEGYVIDVVAAVNQEGWRDPLWIGGYESALWDLMGHLRVTYPQA